MIKIPYEVIALEADKIIQRMVLSKDSSGLYWEQYLFYIEACGWTDSELDSETMRRVDDSWEIIFDPKIFWN
jgi:hypothetical protein